jgi:hypothetical protein
MKGPGSKVGKKEMAIVARSHFLTRGLIFTCQPNHGPGYDGCRPIHNCSADASGHSGIGQLSAGGSHSRCVRQATLDYADRRVLLGLSQTYAGKRDQA